jgi:hypothetical protein
MYRPAACREAIAGAIRCGVTGHAYDKPHSGGVAILQGIQPVCLDSWVWVLPHLDRQKKGTAKMRLVMISILCLSALSAGYWLLETERESAYRNKYDKIRSALAEAHHWDLGSLTDEQFNDLDEETVNALDKLGINDPKND